MTPLKKYHDATVLLVDDDDVDAMGIARALRKRNLGLPLLRARDGVEALEMLQTPGKVRRPFLILLDINMPRKNGLETLAELRLNPELSDSVVFILTTSKSDEDMCAAYRQHIAGYIVKAEMGDGFSGVIDMLAAYISVVSLPTAS